MSSYVQYVFELNKRVPQTMTHVILKIYRTILYNILVWYFTHDLENSLYALEK